MSSSTVPEQRWHARSEKPIAAKAQGLSVPSRPCFYGRLSFAPDGSVEKVERQEADGRSMGERLGWPPFCCVYVDNSRSAWQRNRNRPDWDRMLVTMDATEAHLVPGDSKADHVHDGIMVYHGDRLIRQPYDLELLLNLADQRHVPLASVSGVRNLASPDDRFILRIEAAQACRQSDDTSRRVRRGLLANAQKGRMKWGGVRTFGWGVPTGEVRKVIDQKTGEIIEKPVIDMNKVVDDEIKYLRECGLLVLAGLSGRGALAWMNKRCLTTGGKLWQQGHLKSALCSYRMAGLVEKGGELYEAVWDPVYADDRATALETVEALRAIYASRDNFTYRGPGRKYFLSGIAECSDCHEPSPANPEGSTCDSDPLSCGQQHKTFTRKTINGTPYYVCYQCSRGRSAKNFDAFVTGHVLRLLNSSAFRAALSDRAQQEQSHRPNFAGQIAALRARQQEAKAQMKNLASYPGLDPALLAQAITSFDTEIARLQREAGAVASTGLLDRLAGISEADWGELDVAIRSEALKMLYRVIVYRTAKRGPGFDASAIKMVRNKGPRSLAQLPPA